MSLSFWLNLLFALIVFGVALAYINRSKIKAIRYFLAARLRRKAIPKLKALLPMLRPALAAQSNDPFLLYSVRADLEAICSKADVLFDVEHHALADFLAELSSVIAQHKTGNGTDSQIDNLILTGQRAINELSEFQRTE